MANPYVEFWYVPSQSKPNLSYKVSRRQDGTYACSCPHWIYRHGTDKAFHCKHIIEVLAGGGAALQVLNPVMVKMLGVLTDWCEKIKLGEEFTPDFDGTWRQIVDQRSFLAPAEYTQLEGEFLAAEEFWRTKKAKTDKAEASKSVKVSILGGWASV